jgi:hypothetical protein
VLSPLLDLSVLGSLTSVADRCDALLCEAENAIAPAEGDPVHHTPEDTGATRFDGRIDYPAPGSTFSIG